MGKTATDTKPAGGKLRLNIIDFLIVVVILGAIIGITLRFGLVERITNQSGLTSARISFLILDINDESWNYFAVGDRFIDAEHDCELGVLESRQFIPAEAFIVNEYGEIFKRNSGNEQRIDVRGVLVGEGTFTEDGFLLGGTNYIAPGSTVHMQSANIDVYMTVTAIEKVDDAESQ